MSVVSVKNISKTYGSKKVLDNVTFDIEEGEIFGLLGSNGAGKSTITSIILGLEKPTNGSVVLFEGEFDKNINSKIALVPQETAFYKDFTVEENMSFFASIAGLKGENKKEVCNFLIKWLDLENFRKSKSDFLSGGYQRLLNIALSLLNDPELIFLDEPTVGLDPKMRMMFWDKIKELKAQGKTIILTTHYMDEAQKLCSKVALLKKGKLLTIGNPSDLIQEYGGIKIIVMKIQDGISEGDLKNIKTVLRQDNVLLKGEYLFIPLGQDHSIEKVTGVTEWLMKKGYNILSSTTKEPDLEDVFLNITGDKMIEKD